MIGEGAVAEDDRPGHREGELHRCRWPAEMTVAFPRPPHPLSFLHLQEDAEALDMTLQLRSRQRRRKGETVMVHALSILGPPGSTRGLYHLCRRATAMMLGSRAKLPKLSRVWVVPLTWEGDAPRYGGLGEEIPEASTDSDAEDAETRPAPVRRRPGEGLEQPLPVLPDVPEEADEEGSVDWTAAAEPAVQEAAAPPETWELPEGMQALAAATLSWLEARLGTPLSGPASSRRHAH